MKIKITIILLFTISLAFGQIERPVGINLTSINDYSREFVFTDAFQQCRPWISHDNVDGADWNSEVEIPVNRQGFPLELPYDDGIHPPQIVRTLFLTELEGHNEGGNYRMIIKGKGQVFLWGAAHGTYKTPLDTLVNVDNTAGAVFMELEISDKNNPINDIKFIYPKYAQSFQNQKYTTEFLDFIDDFQCIRLMDWLQTNNSLNENWEDRTPFDNYTQGVDNGVSWETIIEICNLKQKDAWINIPHRATDDYIMKLAQLFKDNLNPNLNIYLEYSNEVWNGIFEQNYYAAEKGAELGYTGEPWERTWKYTAKRSADIFYIFENVFGNSNRFVKIIPTQMVPYIAEKLIEHFNDAFYNPHGVTADVVAMAPYFGGGLGDELGNNGSYSTISVDEILDKTAAAATQAIQDALDIKSVALKHNLKIIAYEGGQHLVAYGENGNLDILTQKLNDANRNPRMKDIYCDYFDQWYDTVKGDMFAVFSSHGRYSRYGSWGIKEYMDDLDAPKYKAILDCVVSENMTSTTQVDGIKAFAFPNPSVDGVFYVHHELGDPKIVIVDVLGNVVPFEKEIMSNHVLKLKINSTGINFIKMIAYENAVTLKIEIQNR